MLKLFASTALLNPKEKEREKKHRPCAFDFKNALEIIVLASLLCRVSSH